MKIPQRVFTPNPATPLTSRAAIKMTETGATADASPTIKTSARAVAPRTPQQEPHKMSRDASPSPTLSGGITFRDDAEERAHDLLLRNNRGYAYTFSVYARKDERRADLDRRIADARCAIIEAEDRIRAAISDGDQHAIKEAQADLGEATSEEQLSGAMSRRFRTEANMCKHELRRMRDPLARSNRA